MLRPLALIAVLFLSAPVAADDKNWTGKTVKLKDSVKLGSKLGDGLVRDGAALEKGKTFVVKSDDGNYLELVGQTGFIFKSEAEVVAGREMPKKGDPVSKVDEKNLWTVGTQVLPKKRTNEIQFGDRDTDGKQVYFELKTLNPTVRKDNGDGWVRIHDGYREGWVSKDDLVTKEDAPIYFDKAVKANPKDTWALFMRGNGWDEKGEYDNAIKDYTEYIRLKPDSSAAYNNRGTAWINKKEYDKAIADFTEAIRLDPKGDSAHFNRGITWSNKKEYDKAIEDYTEAIRLDPEYVPAYHNRGNARMIKKEYDKAIEDYTEAIRLDPMRALVYNDRGAWSKKRDYTKEFADRNKAAELDPANPLFLNNLGWLYATCPAASIRDGKKALESAKKAVKLRDHWDYRDTLAAAYAEAGDFEMAVTEQRKALEDKSLDAADRKKMEARLELYRAKKPYRDEE